MRLSAFVAGMLFTASLAFPALAAPFETPEALLTDIYGLNGASVPPTDAELTTDSFPLQPYLSDHLLSLFQAERDAAPDEPSNLDWDPVIAGQDGEATDVKIGDAVITGDRAEIVVNFINFEPIELIYSLVREHGGWTVDDIAKKDGEYPWSVSEQITTQVQ